MTADMVERFRVPRDGQNPYNMGYGAVYAAYNAVTGGDIGETDVDTGASVVNKDNVADFR